MRAVVRPAVVLLLLLTAATGIAYPLAITGMAQAVMPGRANGDLVRRDGVAIGSALIGQSFTSEQYFRGRPSATGAPDPKEEGKMVDAPYNAAASTGSNLGPLSKKLIERIDGDVAALRKNGATSIPADAVTTSASGLDPHISPAFATLQVARIAHARNIATDRVQTVLQQAIEKPFLGFVGEPRVNVLLLNLALDSTFGRPN